MRPEGADDSVDVILVDPGPDRLATIRAVRDLTGWGLGQAKRLVEACPACVAEEVDRARADEVVARLAAAGAVVRVR